MTEQEQHLPAVQGDLLEAEDPTTTDSVDAAHWIRIYSELIDFKCRLIAKVSAETASLSTDARPKARYDLVLLNAQLDRFRARREFWLRRERELCGEHLDPELRTVSSQGHTVELTQREYQLLGVLLDHAGVALSGRRLIQEAWHDTALSSEQLRLYISRLRAKIAVLPTLEILHRPRRGYAVRLVEAEPGGGG